MWRFSADTGTNLCQFCTSSGAQGVFVVVTGTYGSFFAISSSLVLFD
jgi:hypothetical protein